MTRKHFRLLAAALLAARPADPISLSQWEADCRAIADACRESNPRFHASKFLAACEQKG